VLMRWLLLPCLLAGVKFLALMEIADNKFTLIVERKKTRECIAQLIDDLPNSLSRWILRPVSNLAK